MCSSDLGAVDTLAAYIAPILLGQGRGVLANAVAHTLADAPHFTTVRTTSLGPDVLIEYEARNER